MYIFKLRALLIGPNVMHETIKTNVVHINMLPKTQNRNLRTANIFISFRHYETYNQVTEKNLHYGIIEAMNLKQLKIEQGLKIKYDLY